MSSASQSLIFDDSLISSAWIRGSFSYRDNNGHAFDGGKTYRLHISPNAPVKQSWFLPSEAAKDSPKEVRFGRQQLTHAGFSLSRIDPVPFRRARMIERCHSKLALRFIFPAAPHLRRDMK